MRYAFLMNESAFLWIKGGKMLNKQINFRKCFLWFRSFFIMAVFQLEKYTEKYYKIPPFM